MAVPVQVKEKVTFHRDVYRHLIKGLMNQRNAGHFCDVILRVNGREFFAHKAVLAGASPYFMSMFTSRMKEQSSTDVDLTESLLVDNPDSFRQILDFMYCGDIDISIDNSEDILRIADFLLLEDVKDYCRQFYLQYGNLTLSNCICVSVLAEHHNLPDVAQLARNMIKSRFHDYLIQGDDILDIPISCLLKLLRDEDTVQFARNDHVVNGILHWVNYDIDEREQYLLTLLSGVDLQSLSKESVKLLLKERIIQGNSELVNQLEAIQGLDSETACCNRPQDMCSKLCSDAAAFPHVSQANDGEEDNLVAQNAEEPDPILVVANCNMGFKYMKILVYNTRDHVWYQVPVNGDTLMHAIPPRLTVCNISLHGTMLYMFLSHNLPYPSDLLRIHILALNLYDGQHHLYTFRHFSSQAECCQTTLTDDRSVPPVVTFCRGNLCAVANREGTGQLFVCDTSSETYMCYQVPGTRFISLARVVVKDDRYIYIWCRHRFGHEEYCINKEVTFIRFDCKHRAFTLFDIPSPPGIGYGEFADPHVLCLEGESVVIHTPGKSSLIFDETRNEWLTHHRKLPGYPEQRTPVEVPYHGYDLYTECTGSVFVLQNSAAYTTSMSFLADGVTSAMQLPPPPMDGISLLTSGQLPHSLVHNLSQCHLFDDTYTKLVHNKSGSLDYDTDSGTPHSPNSDSDDDYEYDGYEYDDDIYGYYDNFEF